MRTIDLTLLAVLIAAGPAFAAQEDAEEHAAHHPPAGQEAAAPDEESAGHDRGAAKPSPARENMKRAEDLMRQIGQTSDATEKRELLRAHLLTLREQMKLVRSQGQGTQVAVKEGGKKDAGGMMGGGGMKGGMMGMHQKMEERVEMIERVLQQLIEHEAVEAELEGR